MWHKNYVKSQKHLTGQDHTEKTILLYVRLKTHFLELVRVYRLLKSSHLCSEYKLEIMFEEMPTEILGDMIQTCKDEEINYTVLELKVIQKENAYFGKIKILLLSFLCAVVGGSPTYFKQLYQELIFFRDYFYKKKVSLIVVPEDGVGLTQSLFAAAEELRIPCITVPYEYSTKSQALNAVVNHGIGPSVSKLVALWFKEWATPYNGHMYLRLPKNLIIPMSFLGFKLPLPWSINGGKSSKILCDSEFMKKFYQEEGIAPTKIAVTGNLGHDQIFDLLKSDETLLNAYQEPSLICQENVRVLFAFPPDYTSTHRTNFHKYEDLVDFWIELSDPAGDAAQLLKYKGHIVKPLYQIHPGVTAGQRKYIESRGIMLQTSNIVEILPKVDVLVTSVSSIIRLAIALRKPVLNFDVYNFNYPDYLNIPGVKTIYDAQIFKNEFINLVSNRNYITQLKSAMKEISNDWAIFDGKSKDRVLSEINNCIANA